MPNMTVLLRVLRVSALLLILSACSGEAERYDFATSVAGGPDGWPVWVDNLTFDDRWSVPVGILGGGFDQRPPGGGSIAVVSPKPIPSSLDAEWYSYRSQTFYKIDLALPDDFGERVSQWYDEFPTKTYGHYLITGFSGKGEVIVWWWARCKECGRDRSQDFSAPIVENVMGQEVEGDASVYRAQAEYLVEHGMMPAQSLP